jgi:hypothetical protein
MHGAHYMHAYDSHIMRTALIATADAFESFGSRLKKRADRRRVVNTATLSDLESRGWTDVPATFVLSTGRCGTKLLSELLEVAGGAAVHHASRPELVRVSKLAFERIDDEPELFAEVFKTAREELLHESVRYGKAYVEPNNRVTFFAPAISKLLPDSRFVHLVRHPADIVRSGIRRNWYLGSHAHDFGRIVPRAGTPAADRWDERSQLWKIAWMWQATNEFIERFKEDVGPERVLFVRAEDLFDSADAAAETLRFCGVEPPPSSNIEVIIGRPVNAQKTGDFPRFDQWSDEQRAELRDAAPLALQYGYDV